MSNGSAGGKGLGDKIKSKFDGLLNATTSDNIKKKDASGKPVWWEQVKSNFTSADPEARLKRCSKRKRPPLEGASCSIKPKTCYFGSQKCPGDLNYPTLKCDCKDRKWSCKDKNCAACPATQPQNGTTCSIEALACDYGATLQW